MLDLTKLTELHFDDVRITDPLAVRILSYNIQCLEKNNPEKKYDVIIADSKAALTTLEKAISLSDLTKNSRISKTKTMTEVIDQMHKEASKFEALVHSEFGRGSSVYLKVLPQGLTEISKATKGNLEKLLVRLAEFSVEYKSQLGDKYATIFDTLLKDFQKARDEQQGEKGNVGNLKAEKGSARYNVNVQLQKNLLTILIDNIANETILNSYFDLTLNPKSKASTKKIEEAKAVITPSVAVG